MGARLIILIAAALIFFLPLQPCWAEVSSPKQEIDLNELELPEALADDYSFDDLPFEQLRQALREEVEYGPKKGPSPRSNKRYSLLIR